MALFTKDEKMAWEKIFDGLIMGDHITVERYVDEEDDGDYCVKVTATDKNPPQMLPPVVEPGIVIIPLPPSDPNKRYTFEYDSIDKMYKSFADESGRCTGFTDELKKSIQNQ